MYFKFKRVSIIRKLSSYCKLYSDKEPIISFYMEIFCKREFYSSAAIKFINIDIETGISRYNEMIRV